MSTQKHLSLDEVRQIAEAAFLSNGVSADQTRALTNTIWSAERDQCQSHGLFRVPGYLKSVRSGKVSKDAQPVVSDLAPAIVHVDAANGFSPLALEMGYQPLLSKARQQGIAALAINHGYHFAALWPETERLAEQGLVGFAFVSAKRFVAPAGGIAPLYGTNPMSFAWPRPGHKPLVFDQASSASARGEIQIHLRDGKQVPKGWGIDANGQPTTDPAAILHGAQLPFGGYKGAAIALMIELLAGALIGDVFSYEASINDNDDGGPSSGGEFIIAIDPARCIKTADPESQLARAEQLFAMIVDQQGTRLPSDRRYVARDQTPQTGIHIPVSLYEEIQSLIVDS